MSFNLLPPEEKSYLFKLEVLGENPKEVQSNIELQIQDNIPFRASEVVCDYLPFEQKEDARSVIVSCLPKRVIGEYLGIFHSAGLTPVSLFVESQAVAQAVIPKSNKNTNLIINIQGGKAGFYITTEHTVRFSSTVSVTDIAVDVFNLKIKGASLLGQKYLPVPLRV